LILAMNPFPRWFCHNYVSWILFIYLFLKTQ
jgi:hypothetical protein